MLVVEHVIQPGAKRLSACLGPLPFPTEETSRAPGGFPVVGEEAR